jgi:hypothetical protein
MKKTEITESDDLKPFNLTSVPFCLEIESNGKSICIFLLLVLIN